MNISKYYRNFILCGDLDHHCLLCNETFDDWEDIDKHIRWENHRKIAKTQTVLPQFKNDGIFKISSTYYYCQFCNHISYNMSSIKGHIATEKHTAMKTNPEPNCHNNNFVHAHYDEFECVIISKLEVTNHDWNGINSGKCVLCNKKVSNVKKHIDLQDHVIRLVLTETKYEEADKCHRKINETTVQCLKCMETFTPKDYEKHWPRHKLDVNANLEKPVRLATWSEYLKLCEQEFDIEKLAGITDEFYKVDMKNKEIVCNICNSAVKNTKHDLQNHLYDKHDVYKTSKVIERISEEIDKHYYLVDEKDFGKKRHELATFANENHIKLDAGAHRGYCLICDRFLPPRLDVFEEHVQGITHTGHLELKGLIKPKKQRKKASLLRCESFSRHIVSMEYLIDLDAVAVNYSLCIDRQSFLLLKRIKHGKHMRVTKCLVCEEKFKWWKEKEHCKTETHKSYIMAAKVLSTQLNFIREIKPKLYHCGLCNVTLPYFESLDRHATADKIHKSIQLERNYCQYMKKIKEEQGKLPESKKIELSSINDVLYSNIIGEVFKSRLGGLRVYSIDLKISQPQ